MSRKNFFNEKVIIITGASSGIGRQLALDLSALEARVVLAARREEKILELEKEITASGKKALAVKTDVSRLEEVHNLIDRSIKEWGRIDIYISNAGLYVQKLTSESTLEDYQRSFSVNFFASFHAVKKLIPIMSDQRSGHIVFINSLDAKKGIVTDGPYVTAKSALSGFADVLRQEVKEEGIKVLSVFPGRVDTPMIEEIDVPWISPKISARQVAKATIRAIYKGRASAVVPQLYLTLGAMNDLFPRLMDWNYRLFKLEGKKK